jgi:hypothetical protein
VIEQRPIGPWKSYVVTEELGLTIQGLVAENLAKAEELEALAKPPHFAFQAKH